MVELFEEQKVVLSYLQENPNTLVVAKTGSGKTYMALAHFISKLKPNDRGLYLAPTNVLTEQHAKSFMDCGLDVYLVSSGKKYDLTPKGIYVTTAHYAKVLCEKVKADHFNLLIMDEAHKASSENSPYVYVANHLDCPRVGFTASPGTKIQLNKIKKNLGLENVTTGESPYKYEKKEETIMVENANGSTYEKMMGSLRLKYPVFFKEFSIPTKNYLSYVIKNNYYIKTNLFRANVSSFQYGLIFNALYLAYVYYHESSRVVRNYFMNLNQKYQRLLYPWVKKFNLLNSWIPDKFIKLDELISKEPSISLVFFDNYDTLNQYYDHLVTLKNISKQDIVTIAGKSKMKAKERDSNIARCANSKIILSTSVVEEGVSIVGVDRVIFFRPIYNTIKKIQRVGRTGRHRDGIINILKYPLE